MYLYSLLQYLAPLANVSPTVIDPDYGPWTPRYSGEGPPYIYDRNTPSPPKTKTCEIPSGAASGDDTPAILSAFADCSTDAHIIFANSTYHVGRVMNTTGLRNVDIELRGTLEWSTDIDYWLAHSLPIGFQNQSSAWLLGGDNIRFFGHGHGTLDGNGDEWYLWNNGRSNVQGRPHALTIFNTTNSLVSGLRFLKSQMWTATVTRSERVELSDVYVNNSCNATAADKVGGRCNVNTDGVDTVYADNITFLRWEVTCGDDSISMKQNSTNIYMANNTFHRGQSYAMGSIGQYQGQVNVIENITAVDTILYDTAHAGRIKTWTGRSTGTPPNGGGGGLGYAKNITFANFTLHNVDVPWYITQCTSYNGVEGGCDTSLFKIESMHWGNTTGTVKQDKVVSLQCSAAAPCTGIHIYDSDWTVEGDGSIPTTYLCSNVVDPQGFNCTGMAPSTSA